MSYGEIDQTYSGGPLISSAPTVRIVVSHDRPLQPHELEAFAVLAEAAEEYQCICRLGRRSES